MPYPKKYQKIVNDNLDSVKEMIENGSDIYGIADNLKVPYHSLRSYLKTIGLDLPKKKTPNKGQSIYDCQLIHLDTVNKFLDEGESLSAICERLNLSYGYFYKKLKDRLSRDKTDIIRKRLSVSQRSCDDATENKIIEDYKAGNSMYALTEMYSLKPGVIYGILKRNNVKMNNQSIYWSEDRRKEYSRKCHDGEIGIHAQGDGAYRYTKPERDFAAWCDENDIKYERQFQIKKGTHRYDFLLSGTNILVEIDGEFWHNKNQRSKDEAFEKFANDNGYKVLRFTDKEMHKSKLKCFEKIKVYNLT
jgi:very-short-patch-repair endonuclease